MDLDSAIKQ